MVDIVTDDLWSDDETVIVKALKHLFHVLETAATTKEQPDRESLIISVDKLFPFVNKDTTTTGDIIRSLEAEYDVKFKAPTKTIVKTRLLVLCEGNVQPTNKMKNPMLKKTLIPNRPAMKKRQSGLQRKRKSSFSWVDIL